MEVGERTRPDGTRVTNENKNKNADCHLLQEVTQEDEK